MRRVHRKNLVDVTIWLHPDVWERLRTLSQARGQTVSDVFGAAVEKALHDLGIEVEDDAAALEGAQEAEAAIARGEETLSDVNLEGLQPGSSRNAASFSTWRMWP